MSPGAYAGSCSMGTRVFSYWRGHNGVQLTAEFHLVLRLRMGGAVHVLLLYVFMTWTGTVLLLCSVCKL
jgi:hypothetical protein